MDTYYVLSLYASGKSLTVVEHIAPPPPPLEPYCHKLDEARMKKRKEMRENRELEGMYPIQRCQRNLPLAGTPGHITLKLEVIEQIRCGCREGTQVILVEVNSASHELHGMRLVAKLYDPLAFRHDSYDETDEGKDITDSSYYDPFLLMDRYYTHEVYAYKQLESLQGREIPKFYGSFSAEIPTLVSPVPRQVRLILIDYIPGKTLEEYDASVYNDGTKKLVMEQVIEFERKVYQNNIIPQEICPRNIFVKESRFPRRRTLVFAGLEMACFRESTERRARILTDTRWKDDFLTTEFKDWITEDWEGWIKRNFHM